ncbi:MAG: Phosphoribosylformylglycinamidine synthase, PurS subunit, partial [uncultured Rubrobacteraceae bacterium]
EDPGPRPPEGRHPRSAGRGCEECASRSRFRRSSHGPRRKARRDGGRERGRGRCHVPTPPLQSDDRRVRVGGHRV